MQTEISRYHFSFCCQHQIAYFISCPVKHCKATRRISFASVVRPCLSQRRARLPTDSFNYGHISDRFAVDSPHKSKSRGGCLAARSHESARFTSRNMSQGEGTHGCSSFCQVILASNSYAMNMELFWCINHQQHVRVSVFVSQQNANTEWTWVLKKNHKVLF